MSNTAAELADWMDELETEDVARAHARERLAESGPDTPRARVFRDAARRWLERGHGRVALALLDRVEPLPRADAPGPISAATLPLQTMQLGLPGFGGLPALTEEEATALRACATPEEALVVIGRARRRLDVHGDEARRLLRRWLERQRR